jgi:peptide/nickel transport system permease protein
MLAYVLRRILATIPVMGMVAVFVFLLVHLGPSDPAVIIAGDYATPEAVAKIRERLGLDRPLVEQLWRWTVNLLQGNLGTSIYFNVPITRLIGQRLEPTLALTLSTLTFAVAVAVPLGVAAAWRAGRLLDRCIMVGSVLAFSFPVFVLGYLLIYGLSLGLKVLPVQGYKPLADGVWPFLYHLILPTTTLGMVYVALIARITRASMLEVLNQDYIRTARAKGLSTAAILFRHAIRNASVPIATVVGVGFALLVSGVVITESVFVIPGLGRLTADAVLRRDFPLIQAIVLLFSAAYVLINLAVDLLYTVLDPRIRY